MGPTVGKNLNDAIVSPDGALCTHKKLFAELHLRIVDT